MSTRVRRCVPRRRERPSRELPYRQKCRREKRSRRHSTLLLKPRRPLQPNQRGRQSLHGRRRRDQPQPLRQTGKPMGRRPKLPPCQTLQRSQSPTRGSRLLPQFPIRSRNLSLSRVRRREPHHAPYRHVNRPVRRRTRPGRRSASLRLNRQRLHRRPLRPSPRRISPGPPRGPHRRHPSKRRPLRCGSPPRRKRRQWPLAAPSVRACLPPRPVRCSRPLRTGPHQRPTAVRPPRRRCCLLLPRTIPPPRRTNRPYRQTCPRLAGSCRSGLPCLWRVYGPMCHRRRPWRRNRRKQTNSWTCRLCRRLLPHLPHAPWNNKQFPFLQNCLPKHVPMNRPRRLNCSLAIAWPVPSTPAGQTCCQSLPQVPQLLLLRNWRLRRGWCEARRSRTPRHRLRRKRLHRHRLPCQLSRRKRHARLLRRQLRQSRRPPGTTMGHTVRQPARTKRRGTPARSL
jgi:hypothetical protein